MHSRSQRVGFGRQIFNCAKRISWPPRLLIFSILIAVVLQISTWVGAQTEVEDKVSCSGVGPRANSHEMNAVGVMHQRAGRFDMARRCYNAAIRKRSSFVTPIFNLGTLDMAAGKTKDAVSQFRRVLTLQPTYASAYYNMGTAFIELGQLPLAIDNLRHAVSLDPNYVSAHANLATALHMQVTAVHLPRTFSTARHIFFGNCYRHSRPYSPPLAPLILTATPKIHT